MGKLDSDPNKELLNCHSNDHKKIYTSFQKLQGLRKRIRKMEKDRGKTTRKPHLEFKNHS